MQFLSLSNISNFLLSGKKLHLNNLHVCYYVALLGTSANQLFIAKEVKLTSFPPATFSFIPLAYDLVLALMTTRF